MQFIRNRGIPTPTCTVTVTLPPSPSTNSRDTVTTLSTKVITITSTVSRIRSTTGSTTPNEGSVMKKPVRVRDLISANATLVTEPSHLPTSCPNLWTRTDSCVTSTVTPTPVPITPKPYTLTSVLSVTTFEYVTVDPSGAATLTTKAESGTSKSESLASGQTIIDQTSNMIGVSYSSSEKSKDKSTRDSLGPTSPQKPPPPVETPDNSISRLSQQPASSRLSQIASDPRIFSFGGMTYTASASFAFFIDEMTLDPGRQAVTASGTAFSLAVDRGQVIASIVGNGNIVSTIQVFDPPIASSYATLTNSILGPAIPPGLGRPITIEGQTLTSGRPAVISGTTYSLAEGSSLLLVGSSTISLPVDPAHATVTNAALPSPLSFRPGEPVVVGGQTLIPGIPAVLSGTTYSLAKSSSILVVGTSTFQLPAGSAYATITNAALVSPLTLVSGWPVIVAGQRLTPGAATMISGTVYSLATDGSKLVIGSSTINLPNAEAYTTITNALLPSPLSITSGRPLVIAGQILTPGATATISGTAYSLAIDGSKLIIGSSTIDLGAAGAYTTLTNPLLPSPLPITFGKPIVIAGTTLTPGAVETISGTRYSLAQGSTALVVGSSTIPLVPTGGLGSFIISGVGGAGSGAGAGAGAGAGGGPTSTAYTTNASYTGPVYLGEGGAKLSWSYLWAAAVAALAVGVVLL